MKPSVLYFEGQPRYEQKFLKRVFEGTNLRLAVLVRIAGRLSRSGTLDETELADGFPTRLEELATYDAVILGQLTAQELSVEQELAIVDFVKQGGGLLLLGSLSKDDWQDTALEPILPVDLFTPLEAEHYLEQPFGLSRVERGTVDLHHPALLDARGEVWLPTLETPALFVETPVAATRSGANILLEGQSDDGETTVVLAVWEEGRGRVGVLAAIDTWRWRMKLPPEDQTHETFWRSLVAWLVDSELVAEAPATTPP